MAKAHKNPEKEPTTVRETMQRKVVTIEEDTSAYRAAEIFRDHSIASLVVVRGGHPVGIVTERDVTQRFLLLDERPSAVPVRRFMSSPIFCATPDMDLRQALERMDHLGIRHLPVAEQGKLVGIISLRDLTGKAPEEVLSATTSGTEHQMADESEEGVCDKCGKASEALLFRYGGLLCSDCAWES